MSFTGRCGLHRGEIRLDREKGFSGIFAGCVRTAGLTGVEGQGVVPYDAHFIGVLCCVIDVNDPGGLPWLWPGDVCVAAVSAGADGFPASELVAAVTGAEGDAPSVAA